MTEQEANIFTIAYRDCKEVSYGIDVNEDFGKASTILFYMDEILDALKVASELQAIGTVEEFKTLKEKNESKKVKAISLTHEGRVGNCPTCGKLVRHHEQTTYCVCEQKLSWE